MGFGYLPRPLEKGELLLLKRKVFVRGKLTVPEARNSLIAAGYVDGIEQNPGYFKQQLVRSGIAVQNSGGKPWEAFFTEVRIREEEQ